MNPVALKAENLRTLESLDLAIPEGCCAIVGELRDAPEGASSNGAGKSTVAMIPALCLFGRAAGRPLSKHLTRGGVADGVTVEMVFAHAGETYRLRRGWSAKGRGKPTLDFEVLRNGEGTV